MKKILIVLFLLLTSTASAQDACPENKLEKDLFWGLTDRNTSGEITQLQIFLKNYFSSRVYKVDGLFRIPTRTMVLLYQKENGLFPSGIVGFATRASINSACGLNEVEEKIESTDAATPASSKPTPTPTVQVKPATPASTSEESEDDFSGEDFPTGTSDTGESDSSSDELAGEYYSDVDEDDFSGSEELLFEDEEEEEPAPINPVTTNKPSTTNTSSAAKTSTSTPTTKTTTEKPVATKPTTTPEAKTETKTPSTTATKPTTTPTTTPKPVEKVPKVCSLTTLDGFSAKTLASGKTIKAYLTETVTDGKKCISQNRLCTDGKLSGGYKYATCKEIVTDPCKSTDILKLRECVTNRTGGRES